MSAYGMKPSFTNWDDYQKWIREWKFIYNRISEDCKKRKLQLRTINRDSISAKSVHEKYSYERAMATKMITLRKEAEIRWRNIQMMQKGIRRQFELFPLNFENAKNIDFHFNKKHLEFSQIPMWILKVKGQTYYVNHVTSKIGFSTKERPDHPSTNGMIRFNRATVYITQDGEAIVS